LTLLLVSSLMAVVGGAADATGHSSGDPVEATYTVELENLTSGQYLTPPNWAAHDRSVDVFTPRRAASPGVEAVAERGGVPILAAELAAAVDARGLGISGVGADAPIGPGGTTSFEITTSQDRLSIVSMIICTNDGFAGLDGRRLPSRDGQTWTYFLGDYDAGTELNTENRADIVPAPFCNGEGGTGEDQPEIDQNGRISRHPTLRGVGDMPASFDWRGPVAKVTVTRGVKPPVDEVPPTNYSVTFENLTEGQYFTPPNWATHSPAVSVFRTGFAASEGVEAVAERGGVPILAAELAAAVDARGLGVSGVGAEAPIGPGASASFDVTTSASRLSIVSMIICTNDGFAGLSGKSLPRQEGATSTYYLAGYDAGTELNTENRADIVPAPFCNGEGGTGEDQPEIDENGLITRHQTLQGVGDMPASFDWSGPVVKVTVTNNG